jgi:hypothetical protein
MQNHVPFVSGVHRMAHRTNLVVQILSSLSLVGKIKSLVTSMHNYFAHIPKHHLEASKLAELLECKGNKILKKLEHARFQCYCLPRESLVNTKLWLLKRLKI